MYQYYECFNSGAGKSFVWWTPRHHWMQWVLWQSDLLSSNWNWCGNNALFVFCFPSDFDDFFDRKICVIRTLWDTKEIWKSYLGLGIDIIGTFENRWLEGNPRCKFILHFTSWAVILMVWMRLMLANIIMKKCCPYNTTILLVFPSWSL